MTLHIVFSDGSNLYINYNLPPESFAKEIIKWSKNFSLRFLGVSEDTIFNFEATTK